MSIIKIKSELKSKQNNHEYEGKGILKNKTITYIDEGVKTKITLGKTIWIQRKKDYEIKIGFSDNKTIKGTYIMKEGILEVETKTLQLKTTENSIKIKYKLKINKSTIDTFELNFKYTIDSI